MRGEYRKLRKKLFRTNAKVRDYSEKCLFHKIHIVKNEVLKTIICDICRKENYSDNSLIINMFANRLLAPFVLLALVALYLTWEVDRYYSIWIVPPVIIAALIYVFSPQINWWWYQTRPMPADPLVRMLLGKHLPFYENLRPEEKNRFDHRVELFQMANEFLPEGMEAVPKDIKGLIASQAVWLTFGRKEFIFPKFEKIVVYPHKFPSPQFPETFHASEIFEPDGVLLFSLEQFMPSFLNLYQYYPIALHEFSKVFILSNPTEIYPEVTENFWNLLPKINGLTREKIETFIGLPNLEPLPIAIVHFFVYPEKFVEIFPREGAAFQKIFYPENFQNG